MAVIGGIRLFVLANKHVYYTLLVLWFIFWWFIGGLFFYASSNLGWDEPIPWNKFLSFGLKGMIHPYSILFGLLIPLHSGGLLMK
jgi:hypothetical protein